MERAPKGAIFLLIMVMTGRGFKDIMVIIHTLWSLFIKNAVSYRTDPGTSGCNFGIMRDYYDSSLTVTDDFGKMVQDRVAMAPVELAGRFVRQDDLGLVCLLYTS